MNWKQNRKKEKEEWLVWEWHCISLTPYLTYRTLNRKEIKWYYHINFNVSPIPFNTTNLQKLSLSPPFFPSKQQRFAFHITLNFQVPTMGGHSVFTLAEVASHDNRNDCWLIIEDKVFDHLSLSHPILFDGFLYFYFILFYFIFCSSLDYPFLVFNLYC